MKTKCIVDSDAMFSGMKWNTESPAIPFYNSNIDMTMEYSLSGAGFLNRFAFMITFFACQLNWLKTDDDDKSLLKDEFI